MPGALAFSDPIFEAVLERGEFDLAWLEAFRALPGIDRDPQGWLPEDFRLRHYVAMYLPMRYGVWSSSEQRRNEATEAALAALVSSIEHSLWRGALATPPPSAGDSPIFALALGDENPLRLEDEARVEWHVRFRSAIAASRSAWLARRVWPRWEAMALHAASFYLPMGLPPDGGAPPTRESLANELASFVHDDVARLVDVWLVHAAALRDSAGLPRVSWPRRELGARTAIESLLLAAPE